VEEFALHPRLEADTRPVADWPLCRVRLLDDARFPWLVLVPRVAGAREIHHLPGATRRGLGEEVARAAAALERATGAPKMNVAALGNLVPQLHVHVVARFEDDAAWPGPVWGAAGARPWSEEGARELLARLRGALDEVDLP